MEGKDWICIGIGGCKTVFELELEGRDWGMKQVYDRMETQEAQDALDAQEDLEAWRPRKIGRLGRPKSPKRHQLEFYRIRCGSGCNAGSGRQNRIEWKTRSDGLLDRGWIGWNPGRKTGSG